MQLVRRQINVISRLFQLKHIIQVFPPYFLTCEPFALLFCVFVFVWVCLCSCVAYLLCHRTVCDLWVWHLPFTSPTKYTLTTLLHVGHQRCLSHWSEHDVALFEPCLWRLIDAKINDKVIIAILKSEPIGKLINRIPGSCLWDQVYQARLWGACWIVRQG